MRRGSAACCSWRSRPAYVCEVPRLGLLGWNRIYLVLGFPYLLALTPEELEGVVAHELAHVARRHGAGFAGVRGSLARWQQLDTHLDERQHWSGKFFPAVPQALCAASRAGDARGPALARVRGGQGCRGGCGGRRRDERPAPDLAARPTSGRGALGRADETCRSRAAPNSLHALRPVARLDFQHGPARLTELLRHVESDWSHPATAQRLRAIGVTTIQPSRLKPPAASAADV